MTRDPRVSPIRGDVLEDGSERIKVLAPESDKHKNVIYQRWSGSRRTMTVRCDRSQWQAKAQNWMVAK